MTSIMRLALLNFRKISGILDVYIVLVYGPKGPTIKKVTEPPVTFLFYISSISLSFIASLSGTLLFSTFSCPCSSDVAVFFSLFDSLHNIFRHFDPPSSQYCMIILPNLDRIQSANRGHLHILKFASASFKIMDHLLG